ncbi:hypothetical protein LTR62_006656 [Meristemomyces frigidus]|uniref:Uncharacterized protein n=1 Tax=Meristemomyces frigidus TaxID=1508187 RepID=A0AAN7TNR0_9PEZI|nr:hypothetical protein LTR62_006656 [Meristemomyces frigidus]
MGMAYLSCQIYILWCYFGSDFIEHLSEEVQNASVIVPRAIWWSYIAHLRADKGLPGSNWIGHMDKRYQIPFNAICLMSLCAALLSVVVIGSQTAFSVLVSLSTLGIMTTYLISVGCVLLKHLRSRTLPYGRWSFERFGTAVNAFAVLYRLFIVIVCCFPSTQPVDAATANWAPLIWFAVIGLVAVRYGLHGRRAYTPPVQLVAGRKGGGGWVAAFFVGRMGGKMGRRFVWLWIEM